MSRQFSVVTRGVVAVLASEGLLSSMCQDMSPEAQSCFSSVGTLLAFVRPFVSVREHMIPQVCSTDCGIITTFTFEKLFASNIATNMGMGTNMNFQNCSLLAGVT